jgi:hypothetical protein
MNHSCKRFATRSICLHAMLAVVILASAAPNTVGAAVSTAYLQMFNLTETVWTDPQSVSGRMETANGVVTRGNSSFHGGMDIDMTSALGRGVTARAYLDDDLVFHIPGGGSAQVNVTIAGTWYGTYDYSVNADFQVGFSLGLDSTIYSGNGYSTTYVDGLPGSLAFTANRGNGSVVGTYSFTRPWTVYDGQVHGLFAAISAQASHGAIAHIDDPLFITLPAGVTLTSTSGSTYAVPEPSSLLLLGAGLAAVALRRGSRRSDPV